VQPLPSVPMPSAASTTASGLQLVTEDSDVEAVLAADRRVECSKLPSNRNSIPARASCRPTPDAPTDTREGGSLTVLAVTDTHLIEGSRKSYSAANSDAVSTGAATHVGGESPRDSSGMSQSNAAAQTEERSTAVSPTDASGQDTDGVAPLGEDLVARDDEHSGWLGEVQDAAERTWTAGSGGAIGGIQSLGPESSGGQGGQGGTRRGGEKGAHTSLMGKEIQGEWGKYVAEKQRMLRNGRGNSSVSQVPGGRGSDVRIGGGLKLPAGGAPAGSRLGAMVGDSEYYVKLAEQQQQQQQQQQQIMEREATQDDS
jgi:hypothetical protein